MVELEELTDRQWYAIQGVLPPERHGRGRPWRQHRQVINGILWVLHTGNSWRAMPGRFGPWETAYTRYRRWQANGTWERIEALLASSDPH